jgi:hypothetical protein
VHEKMFMKAKERKLLPETAEDEKIKPKSGKKDRKPATIQGKVEGKKKLLNDDADVEGETTV